MTDYKKDSVNGLIDRFLSKKTDAKGYVSQRDVEQIILQIKHMFFPETKRPTRKYISKKAEAKGLFKLVKGQIEASLNSDKKSEAEKLTYEFLQSLPEIKDKLEKDLVAFLKGDPAAESDKEVILCYPGFHAIFTYRLAHRFYELGIPILPRVFTELAHKKTGIDIHPGARIGEYFFIDHGTGVVIGETAEVGNYVKIYQGVTLGAVSLKNAESLKGKKRHPTVLSGVTIYANATVLGGNTVIGENLTVPSAAFITKSQGV